MIKAVIFDMDGVISDSETTNFKAMLKTLSPFSITFDFKYYSRFPGGSCIEAYETIKRDFDADFDVNELVNAFNEMRVEIAKTDGWKPVENAIDTVKYCKEKYSLALASGSNPHIIKDIMQSFEIEQYFDSFISGETIEKCKPDPMIFEKSAAALSVLPNECVVIEDSKNGVLAAKAAGMLCIGYRNVMSGNQDLSHADYIIDDMADVKNIL